MECMGCPDIHIQYVHVQIMWTLHPNFNKWVCGLCLLSSIAIELTYLMIMNCLAIVVLERLDGRFEDGRYFDGATSGLRICFSNFSIMKIFDTQKGNMI